MQLELLLPVTIIKCLSPVIPSLGAFERGGIALYLGDNEQSEPFPPQRKSISTLASHIKVNLDVVSPEYFAVWNSEKESDPSEKAGTSPR